MKLLTQVLIHSAIALTFAVSQKDPDEGRPYEFGFTIDGQQHRHEKKDQNGIIQGEFGFITADGVYHVTVYATDENGNFKILSMRNIRISAPLDGSPAYAPISPDAGKYLKNPNTAIAPVKKLEKLQQQLPVQQTFTEAPKLKAFTTQATIKPACAGCGYVTTSKPLKPGELNAFHTPQAPSGNGIQNGFSRQSQNGVANGFLQNPQNSNNFNGNAGSPRFPQGPATFQYQKQSLSNQQQTFSNQQLPPDVELLPPSADPGSRLQNQLSPQNIDKGNLIAPGGGLENQQVITLNNVRSSLKVPLDVRGSFDIGNDKPSQGVGPNPILQPGNVSKLPPVTVSNNVIHVGGKNPKDIPIKDKFPGMVDGLPAGVEETDVKNILYKFKYTVGFHGHYEKGLKNGTKIGGYFVNGRDGISRVVTYVADENGFRPKFKFINLGLDSPDTPKAGTEKTFGLKEFEFVWYPIE